MIIQLTKGYSTVIDDEDYHLISHRKWQYCNGYAVSGSNNPKNHLRLARIIINAPYGLMVDHINGNTLDNRKQNLRLADDRQNQANRGNPTNNTSGYKGVVWHKGKKRWMVSTNAVIDGKRNNIFGGYFRDIKDAARKYNQLALEIWGEYARLNEVIDD